MSPQEMVQKAKEYANKEVPEFEKINTPEHEKWVMAFDYAMRKMIFESNHELFKDL